MPLPKPDSGETEKNFVSRCMGDETMKKEYDDNKQRAAVCYSLYKQKKESVTMYDFRSLVESTQNLLGEKKDKYEIYHRSYTDAINEIEAHVERNGFAIDPEDMFYAVGVGPRKPSLGNTNNIELPLYKNGKPSNRKIIAQVYNTGSRYELNMYFGQARPQDFRESLEEASAGNETFFVKMADPRSNKKEKMFYNKKRAIEYAKKIGGIVVRPSSVYSTNFGTSSRMDVVWSESVELTESIMNVDDFARDIETLFLKYFPRSHVSAKFSKSLSPSISISFLLGKGNNEYSFNIPENDPVKQLFFVWMRNAVDEEGNIIGPVELERSLGNILIPDETGRKAFVRVKVPFRKSKGDPATIMNGLDRYLKRLKKAVVDNMDKIRVPFDISTKL